MPYENGKHITLDEWRLRHPPQFTTTNTGGAPLPEIVRQSVLSESPQAPAPRPASVKRAIQKATGVDLDATTVDDLVDFDDLDAITANVIDVATTEEI